tara:strand:+ start:229 stop:2541 length:2313 start_codon:yes stop_codon:yes gene_type:complete
MPKVTGAKQNFTAGELSPRLHGRTDLGRYQNGAKTLENFLVQPHGGVTRRPGTKFVKEVKTSANQTRLIPFQFNVDQAYIIEFGNQYIRFYKDGGNIVSSGSPVEVATPYLTADLPDIVYAQTADVMYIVHPDHAPRKLTRTSHTAWTLTVVDFYFGSFLPENTTTTTIRTGDVEGSVSVISSTDLFASTDVGRLIRFREYGHDGYCKITAYTDATTVTATVQPNNEDFDGDDLLVPSYTADTISAHEGDPSSTGLEHNDRFQDTAGNFLKQGFNSNSYIGTSSFTNSANNKTGDNKFHVVDATDTVLTIAPAFDLVDEAAGSNRSVFGYRKSNNEWSNWSLGAWSATTGYPRTVAFYEQRLVFGGTATEPQTLWFSASGDYENFRPGTDPTSALTYTIGSNQVNVIRYLSSSNQLLVGTSGGEFVVRASGQDNPITPTDTQIKQTTTYGSSTSQPLQIGNSTLFLQRAKRKLREFVYNSDVASYTAPDMTILAEHISEGGLSEMAYQQEPDSNVWAVRADGELVCMTYRREEQVVAWHRHVIGGVFSSGNAVVESVATIPGDLNEDQVWVIVKRTIGGATKRYIEYLSNFDFGTSVEDAFFVDSGLTYSGSSATSISGLDHLEGQSVAILANGATHPNKTVSSGAITLDYAVTKAQIGLSFTSTLETLKFDGGSALGSSQGKIKRINDIVVRLYRSVGLKVGTSSTNVDTVPFRTSSSAMDTALSMFSGDKIIEFKGGYDEDATFVILQDQPLPMTVLAIFPTLTVYDK